MGWIGGGGPVGQTTNVKAMASREAELEWIERRVRSQRLSARESLRFLIDDWMGQMQWKNHRSNSSFDSLGPGLTRATRPDKNVMHGTLNTWREWGWFGLLYWHRGVCRQDSQLNMWTWSLRGKLRLWTCPWNLWNSWHLSQNGWSSWGGQMYLYILSSKRSFLTTLPIILTSLTVVCVSSRHLLYPVLYYYCLT